MLSLTNKKNRSLRSSIRIKPGTRYIRPCHRLIFFGCLTNSANSGGHRKMNKSQLTCFFLQVNLDQTGTETQTANIVICILNSVFSLITCMGNSVILHVIRKTQELLRHLSSFCLVSPLQISWLD